MFLRDAHLVISDPCYSIMGFEFGLFDDLPATDPSIRVQTSCHCFFFYFFFICAIFMKREMKRKRVTHVVFSHLPTSEAVNRGLVFTLILCRVHLKFKGWRAGSITLL